MNLQHNATLNLLPHEKIMLTKTFLLRGLAESFPQAGNNVTVSLERQLTGQSWPEKLRFHRSVNEKSIGFEIIPKSSFPCASHAGILVRNEIYLMEV